MLGRLRDAYMEALKHKRVGEIQRILVEAKKLNQNHVVKICEDWLSNRERQELEASRRLAANSTNINNAYTSRSNTGNSRTK